MPWKSNLGEEGFFMVHSTWAESTVVRKSWPWELEVGGQVASVFMK